MLTEEISDPLAHAADQAVAVTAAQTLPLHPQENAVAQAIEKLANAESYREAIHELMTWAGQTSGASHVRVVVGDSKITQIWDQRLGKIKRDSPLWDIASAHWLRASQHLVDRNEDNSERWLFLSENFSKANCPTNRDRIEPQCIAIWLSGRPLNDEALEVLHHYGGAISAILLHRPRRPRYFRLSNEYRGWLTWTGFAVTMALGIALFPRPYKVSCGVTVQSIGERIVAAPFESTLLRCVVSPGDEVEAGDLLLQLDGRPLILELEALKADLGQASKEVSVALAAGRVADSQVAKLECQQLESRIELLQHRLGQLEIRSPIRGVVVSGDLKNAVGRPFETGDSLLEIAPLERMKLEFEIPETEIHYIAAGDPVKARLESAVFEPLEGTLQTVYPQAEVREDKNCFVATWEFSNSKGFIRPGMTGRAVVYGDEKPIILRWARPLIESILRAVGW